MIHLKVPITGNNYIYFKTETGLIVAKGYIRVVIGERGPYVEFAHHQLKMDRFFIPDDCKYRLTNRNVYYYEYRTIDESYVKLYYQLKTVRYADYRVGLYYISPSDLFVDGEPIVQITGR